MSTRSTRIGALIGIAALLTVSIAAGQHRAADGDAPEGRGVAVFNPVDGRIRVLSGLPDGARVEKGGIVCELDPAGLRDRLDSQEVAVQGLRAGVQGARIAREVAVLELKEHKEGRKVQELMATEVTIKTAQADLVRHEDKLEWAQRMFNKGYASKAEQVSQKLAFEKAKYALEKAQVAKQVLVRNTQQREIRALMAAVETARGRELGKEAALRRAESALKSLHDQIGGCKVAAPAAGRVRYDAPIGPNAVVLDGQVLFRVVPDPPATDAAK